MTKAELRKTYIAKQRLLSPKERTEKSKQISDRFFQIFDPAQIKFLHCFIAIEKFNEIDTSLIFQRFWREFPQITTLVPRVDFETDEMQSLKFTADTELVQNAWQIHEPSHNEYVETEKIDMVLAPLLCFDAKGHRVGYGKGFYDKFLSKCRENCVKIGLSYFEPVEEILDVSEFDVTLDYFVTPNDIFEMQVKRDSETR